ncbi:hypothetical protein GCM10012280_38410 [Wenjunlia tyrosinilytica]|uniref:HTH hxlR-type domain-containing protein n=1 Tax=Wenjunlia tyrosinilytica TaxID=1544741 RepID=A0A918DZU6_9ACTN|nr:hypothetical protein GCM10012280_38410 [Wenjunlia tyrosinilytica]
MGWVIVGGVTEPLSPVLTEALRAMERDGPVIRTASEESPPRAEYEPTALGRSLPNPLAAARDRARERPAEMAQAREAHERRAAGTAPHRSGDPEGALPR